MTRDEIMNENLKAEMPGGPFVIIVNHPDPANTAPFSVIMDRDGPFKSYEAAKKAATEFIDADYEVSITYAYDRYDWFAYIDAQS